MKHCDSGIGGIRSHLSPLARPFTLDPSPSSVQPGSESELEDSIWGDYAFDLSFLTSDDQISGGHDDDSLSDLSRDADAIVLLKAEGSKLSGQAASASETRTQDFAGVLKDMSTTPSPNSVSAANMKSQRTNGNNPNSFFSKMSELQTRCSAGDNKMDLLGCNTTAISEKPLVPSDQDDSEVDSPCWRGMKSHNIQASGSMRSRRSTDDLNRFFGLNPLAPQFIPANAKKSLDKHVKGCEENGSSSLKKSLSSTFPLSSIDYNNSSIDIPQQDRDSNTASISESSNEYQTSSKLDPSAPLFVPSTTKSIAAIYPSGNMSLNSWRGSSVEDHFRSAKQVAAKTKDLSMKGGNKDIARRPSSSSSREMDVKNLLTTMHGMSELLALVRDHSQCSDSTDEQETVLINNIVQNLNLYNNNRVKEHSRTSSHVRRGSYDSNHHPNKRLEAKDMTIKLDLARKENHTFTQVIANSAVQENLQIEEQLSPEVLFYRSLWLKAEAERCLVKYEAFLSRKKH